MSILQSAWKRLNQPIRFFGPTADVKAAPLKPSRNLVGVMNDTDNLLSSMMGDDKCSADDALKRLNYSSPHVYACMWRYLYALSPIRWKVKKKVGDGNYQDVADHEIEKVLAYPNIHMGGGSLNRRRAQHLLGCGNAYERKIRGHGNRVVQIYPMDPRLVAPIPDGNTFLSGYRVKANANDPYGVVLGIQDVIHYQLEDPTNIYEGIGIVQANTKTIDSDTHAQNFWFNSIKRSIRKNGILSFKHDYSVEEAEELDKKLREDVLGSWNAGGVLFLGQEHTWTDLSKNVQDVDFAKARSMLREYIAAIFSVPAPMVGILDNSTYNNIQMARMIFWLDTLLPFLEIIREQMTLAFFFSENKGDARYEYIVDYDVSSVEALYYVFGQKLDLALKLFKMGIHTYEIVKQLNLGIPESACPDSGFLPLSTTTPEQIIEGPDSSDPNSDNFLPAQPPFSRNTSPASPPVRQSPVINNQQGTDIVSERSLRLAGMDLESSISRVAKYLHPEQFVGSDGGPRKKTNGVVLGRAD